MTKTLTSLLGILSHFVKVHKSDLDVQQASGRLFLLHIQVNFMCRYDKFKINLSLSFIWNNPGIDFI